MGENDFYYRLDNRMDERLKKLKPTINQKHIKDYDTFCKERDTGNSIATTTTNKQKLIILFEKYVNQDWLKYTKDTADKIRIAINEDRTTSARTKSNNKKILKQLDKFLNNRVEPSERTRLWNTIVPKRQKKVITGRDILTEDDKKKLIRACDNSRDKAMICLWLETGLRPKELRVLTVGSIEFGKDMATIHLPNDTKTGYRSIPFYFAKPALLEFIKQHPGKDDDNSPLWFNLRRNKIQPMGFPGFEYILKKIVGRSGIKKRVYWYLGRHTSYTTKVEQGWSEGLIKDYHGIEPGSGILKTYVHTREGQIKEKVAEYYGLAKSKKKDTSLRIIKCLNCNSENQSTEPRCVKCGYILDPKIMQNELISREKETKAKEEEISELRKQMAETEKNRLMDNKRFMESIESLKDLMGFYNEGMEKKKK